MEKRFGIPETVFNNYLLFKKNKSWWILNNADLPEGVCQLKVWRVGLKAFQEVSSFIKPTTGFIQIFGNRAVKAIISLKEKDLLKLANGENIPSPLELEIDNGYVIITLGKKILGLGLLINGYVRSQIPKKDLRFLIQIIKDRPES